MKKARSILLDSRMSERCLNSLERELGGALRMILLPPCGDLQEPVACHPDMLVYRLSDALLTDRRYYLENRALFDGLGLPVKLGEAPLSPFYPCDVRFNALRAGGRIFCRRASADPLILAEGETVDVRQGYARCSVCMLGDSAATADEGLYRALAGAGVDALKLQAGNVRLDGYGCGFIGGASASLPDGRTVFFGDITAHPDWEALKAFAERHGTSLVPLTDEPLYDCGGAVFV